MVIFLGTHNPCMLLLKVAVQSDSSAPISQWSIVHTAGNSKLEINNRDNKLTKG